jgi:hypothetical protein
LVDWHDDYSILSCHVNGQSGQANLEIEDMECEDLECKAGSNRTGGIGDEYNFDCKSGIAYIAAYSDCMMTALAYNSS